ncbi:MAG: EAL domain-containing protein [Terracidiphilus sp.]
MKIGENSDLGQRQEVLDSLPVLVFLERAGRVVFANAEARRTLGVADDEWSERPVEDVLWGLFAGTAEPRTELIGSRRSRPFHATLPAANGRLLPVEGTYSVLDADLGEAVIVAHPSGREQAPKSRLMEDVLASIPEAVVIVHDNHVLYTNQAFTRIFGYTAEEASGGDLRELIVPETRRHEHAMLEYAVDRQGTATFQTVCLNKDGESLDVSMLAGPLLVDGARIGYIITCRETGDRKRDEVQRDVLRDTLTGLPNRAFFLERLSLALARWAGRSNRSCGVLLLDIDRFKELDALLGRAATDMLLIAVGDRLRAALRPQDSACRLGGDQFAVLVEDIVEVNDLRMLANRISRELERPFEIYGRFVQAHASIGVAIAGSDYTTPESLIRDADFAMCCAKQEGGGRIEIFNKGLEAQVANRLDREQELRQVLERREFELWFQPIYRLENGKLEGFESLLRWRRPDGIVESFRDLLGVADDTGLSIDLNRETIDAACRQLRTWSEVLPGNELTMTVNLTHRQFYHPGFVVQLQEALAANNVDPSRLLFEVEESTLNQRPDAAMTILRSMVECQVRIAVDNFGAGLAPPLTHLLGLPIDVLKLTPRLTASAISAGRQQALLESLIHLGKMLGMQVIAQGIESAAQLDALCQMGCELGQGHLLSHALEVDRATKLVELGYWGVVPNA